MGIRLSYFIMANSNLSIKERFETKYEILENGCWKWTSLSYKKTGYGILKVKGKKKKAHRISYELYKGNPDGMLVCHKCDFPPCVNPDHLFLGTYKDNANDAQHKGRRPLAVHPSRGWFKKGCRCEECVACESNHKRNYREYMKANFPDLYKERLKKAQAKYNAKRLPKSKTPNQY